MAKRRPSGDEMVRMMLHEALDMAVKQKLIASNPTNGTTLPKNNYALKQILNDEQLNRFMEVIKDDERWYDFFYTEIITGLRKGEICGLKWVDFDEYCSTLKIKRSKRFSKTVGGFQFVGCFLLRTDFRDPNDVCMRIHIRTRADKNFVRNDMIEQEITKHPF